jgi:DNA polymerase III delta prime subunit
MDAQVGKFIDIFATAVQLAQAQQPPMERGNELLTTLSDHLGSPAAEVPLVVETFPAHRYADLDIALSGLAETDPAARLVGIGGGDQRHHSALNDLLQQARMYPQFPLAQPDYANEAIGPEDQRQVVSLGIYLLEYDGVRLAVLQRAANDRYGRQEASVEVLAAQPAAAAAFLTELRNRMQGRSVIKGQVVTLTINPYGASGSGVTFHHRPTLVADDVILPEGLLAKVSDHTVRADSQQELLRSLGQHLKRGILLYGPPGTGKTHTVRYLLSQTPGTTAILLSGNSLAFVAEAARMARALQPSIVVLEDCDLIAEDRSFSNGPQPLLFEVLDAMDGLDDDADVAFVLTTNRADLLERALAQRPGRVDLAVEIPKPAAAQREALLALYGREMGFSPAALAQVAAATNGTTASFARELVRRSVIVASRRGEAPADSHLVAAAEDMMADSQALTRSLLGSGPEVTNEPDPGQMWS